MSELAEDVEIAGRPADLYHLIPTADETTLVPRALELAIRLGHPVYDRIYLGLAEAGDDALLTADARFIRALDDTPFCRANAGVGKMNEDMTGGCACGRVRYSVPIDSDEAYLCHCRMCQRATGSVSIAFKNVCKADVAWGGEPDWYQSSPIARRPYCSACGTSLGFTYPDSEKMDLTVASFDDPGRFRPASHFGAESMHRAWLNTEGLPETRSDAYQPLVARWTKATGGMPG